MDSFGKVDFAGSREKDSLTEVNPAALIDHVARAGHAPSCVTKAEKLL